MFETKDARATGFNVFWYEYWSGFSTESIRYVYLWL